MMHLSRVASLLVALVALLYCQPAAAHPYDPHEHQQSPFFEGWFLRVTTSNNGPTFAVGIGHLPQQSVRNPSAACFLLLNPPADDAAAAAAAAAATNTSNLSIKAGSSGSLVLPQPRTYTHYFSSLDVQPGKQQAGCIGCPAFVAYGENAGGSCRLEVTGSLVILEAKVPGAFKLLASNDPNTASILPWGDDPASSPEGWLPGPLLKLHWYVYSMSTPINYQLTLLDTTTAEETVATAAPNSNQQHQQRFDDTANLGPGSGFETPGSSSSSSSSSSDDTNHRASRADGAAISFSGSGFAHMEKNWGDAFPEQWVWAQGISGDGKSSFVLAGGSLPIKRPSNSWATSALNTLLSLPFPHTTNWREEPLAFAFSLHSPGVNLTVDPSHPGWVSSFEPCACCSSMAIKLSSWGHEVVLRVEAQRGSFAGLPCPTEDGFTYKSDESFAATAHIRVYGSSSSTSATPATTTSMLSAPFGWRGKHSKPSEKLLLASAVFEGAALEFGGLFRCAGAGKKDWAGPPWHKLFAQQ